MNTQRHQNQKHFHYTKCHRSCGALCRDHGQYKGVAENHCCRQRNQRRSLQALIRSDDQLLAIARSCIAHDLCRWVKPNAAKWRPLPLDVSAALACVQRIHDATRSLNTRR